MKPSESISLPDETDVVIIGAGIAGMSTAWFLNQAGLRVVVCEKSKVACEQSSRNWGWIRQQGRDEAELPIVMESMSLWQQIADQVDSDIGYRRSGAIYLCENQEDEQRHEPFNKLAPQYGLETRFINREELKSLIKNCPDLWQSGLYTPDDGRAEPSLAVPAMSRKLAERGVIIAEDCAVIGLETTNGIIKGVQTEHDLIKCSQVLCSAGAWSTFFLKQQGINLPQLTVKASVGRTAPGPDIYDGNASGSQIAFRRRLDGGYNVAMTQYLEVFPSFHHLSLAKPFFPLLKNSLKKLKFRYPELKVNGDIYRHRVLDPKPSANTVSQLRKLLDSRLPELRNTELVECWSGMIDALPDVVPVLDKADTIEGLWIATGFSGHGFGIGPAAGKIMANLMQNNMPGYDLNRFRLSRFSDGSPMILGPAI
ncbi:MAG: glycine/D-amino acid oxidase-like deaminating enzyme [Gammaproteobacteria bacterium]|jgi:glycine/D-amino acid oxidase-like deaminating enzyme